MLTMANIKARLKNIEKRYKPVKEILIIGHGCFEDLSKLTDEEIQACMAKHDIKPEGTGLVKVIDLPCYTCQEPCKPVFKGGKKY